MKIYNFKKLLEIIIPISITFFNLIILLFPQDIITASKFGIHLLINNVVPSLLPFIIFTNILIGLGAVNFIGSLLEPIMYPIFRVPGIGGFALITGMTSGYPVGAKVISDLRKKNYITKYEAQRLISFSNNSGPLFILGVVGISIFKNIKVGYFIMFLHYTSAIITGLIFKYYKINSKSHKVYIQNKNLILKSFKSMRSSRIKDGRTFPQILVDSISNSMQSMLNIGGFIIISCVIIKIFEITNLINIIKIILSPLLTTFNISDNLFKGFIIGLIEITNGTKILGYEGINQFSILTTAAIISFGGFSIHAQTIAFISKTDINIFLYILSKLLHSIITVVLGILLYPILNLQTKEVITVSNINTSSIFNNFLLSFTIFFALITTVIITSLITNIFFKIIKRSFF